MNPLLKVHQVSIAYGKNVVVKDVSLQLNEGEIGCLLGLSGCGKTSLLRAIAGFEKVQTGSISLKQRIISSDSTCVPPEKRNMGMVFQDFALFPHLTVADNIAFGIRHLKRSEQKQRTQQLLKLVSLQGFEQRYPHELSGGQQQRIALIRALAPRPDLLLLDEPFSSMDVELREALAQEVRAILKQENTTAMLVTHDQNEAFAVADYIGVIDQGKLRQWADDYTLYHQPATPFIANFIGQGTFIEGEVLNEHDIQTGLSILKGKVPHGCRSGCKVKVFIRPDDIVLDSNAPLKVTITDRAFRGADFLYTLQLGDGSILFTLEHSHHRHEIGEQVGIALELDHVVVFAKDDARYKDIMANAV